MNAEIITIGDELLIGQVMNSNQAFIAERLNSIGVHVDRMITVGDNEDAIIHSLAAALAKSSVVCVTGGLGPTHDDITKKALCNFFQTDVIRNCDVLRHISSMLERRHIPVTELNKQQADVPRNCTVLHNENGTAPGMLFNAATNGHPSMLFVLPGVPFEMRGIVDTHIVPLLRGKSPNIITHKTLRTTGIAESLLADRLGCISDIIGADEKMTLAFLPSPGGVRLRLSAEDKSETLTIDRIEAASKMIRDKVGIFLYSDQDQELEAVIGQLLTEKKLSLSTVESCTGGMIANRITNIAGSSAYFTAGFVTYSNESKVSLLKVPREILQQFGAVSREVAEALAAGGAAAANSDISCSITGIAGPGGGSEQKPVGTAWIGLKDKNGIWSRHYNFGDDRLRFKERASQKVLDLIRRSVSGLPLE